MDEKKTLTLFQTLFVTQETCNSPLIIEILKLAQKIKELNLDSDTKWCISFDYGRRILINAFDIDQNNPKQEDVVEVVDFDPFKNIALVIGKKHPCRETPVHWIIQKARTDVNVILELSNKKLYQQLEKKLPSTEKEAPVGTIDLAKEMLKTMRENKMFLVKNQGVLISGFNTNEVIESLLKLRGK